jgi:DNA invertase Pin-like site-specific DNA recombinase
VWVNTGSGVYHFPGTHNYGHTKQGVYMCEADAKAVGDRAAKNEKHPRGSDGGALTAGVAFIPMTELRAAESGRLYVGYYRVSTGKQSFSGLGLDAQRAEVREYVCAKQGRLIAEYSEAASARKGGRPQLKAALSLCRITRATMVVARLDRLSRSVELITGLMESGLDFVAVDFPKATKFTIHILAAVAEYESEIQSERMKAMHAARRMHRIDEENTKRTWTRRFPSGCQHKSARVREARADARAVDLAPLVQKALAAGKSYAVIAAEFNRDGIRPPRRAPWSSDSIWRLIQRIPEPHRPKTTGGKRPPTSVVQVRIDEVLREVGSVLINMRERNVPYDEIGDELMRREIQPPRGTRWWRGSIRRYVLRALGVQSPR